MILKRSRLLVVFAFVIILIILYFLFLNKKEGFQQWPRDLVKKFMAFEETYYPLAKFNFNVLQKQASPDEVDTLLKTGFWPWDQTTKYMYMDSVAHNSVLNINPAESLDYASRLYNNQAMKQKLAYNAKEGQFLIYGGLIHPNKNKDDIIVCDNGKMKQTQWGNYTWWNGYRNKESSFVENEDIPKVMPGFNFIHGPCNPCDNLEPENGYNCPFTLNVAGSNDVSPIWKELWSF